MNHVFPFLLIYVAQSICFECPKNIALKGAGSSAVAGFLTDMGIMFAKNRSERGISISFSYLERGSGFGKLQITNKRTDIVFAASESLLSAENELENPLLTTIPSVAA